MSDFTVNILGCGSATPSLRHLPSSQVINHDGRLFMVDCGEGAQLQMRRMKIGFSRLRHIFISHLHGDHFLGLPGLLSTLSLHEVPGQVHVYTFPEAIAWLREFQRISRHHSTVDVVYHPVTTEAAVVYEDDKLTVSTFPLNHRIPCVGYLFREKPGRRRLLGDVAERLQVPAAYRPGIKDGNDYITPAGVVIPNSELTADPAPPLSYAYCSDTIACARVTEAVRGVDLLYHEATYADDMAAKARDRGHSTARQAAQTARDAGARRLLIGHYSKSYESEEPLLAQAREVFPDTLGATEGMTVHVDPAHDA